MTDRGQKEHEADVRAVRAATGRASYRVEQYATSTANRSAAEHRYEVARHRMKVKDRDGYPEVFADDTGDYDYHETLEPDYTDLLAAADAHFDKRPRHK